MADQLFHTVITEGPNGSASNFTLTRYTVKPGIVTDIFVRIPRGHARLTGIQIAYGQKQIIPDPPSIYYRGNDQTLHFQPSDLFPTGNDWWIQTFNSDRYSHSWDIRFEGDALDLSGGRFPPVILLPFVGSGFEDVGDGTELPTPGEPIGLPGVGPAIPA